MRGPIPGSDCQPVSIVVPLHTHIVGMVKYRKDCVKVKLSSYVIQQEYHCTVLSHDHMCIMLMVTLRIQMGWAP